MEIKYGKDDSQSFKKNRQVWHMRITGNDNYLHMSSLKDTIIQAFRDRLPKRKIKKIINTMEEMVVKNTDECENGFMVEVDLGKKIPLIQLEIYPTYDSWSHIRDEYNKDVV